MFFTGGGTMIGIEKRGIDVSLDLDQKADLIIDQSRAHALALRGMSNKTRES